MAARRASNTRMALRPRLAPPARRSRFSISRILSPGCARRYTPRLSSISLWLRWRAVLLAPGGLRSRRVPGFRSPLFFAPAWTALHASVPALQLFEEPLALRARAGRARKGKEKRFIPPRFPLIRSTRPWSLREALSSRLACFRKSSRRKAAGEWPRPASD